MSTVTVMVACNDDAGNCSGRAAALRIELPEGDYAYEGAGVYGQGDGPVCRHGAGPTYYNGDGQLRLGRFRYRTIGHTAWLGNMAWDGFRLSEHEARRLKADQERSGWWQCMEEPVDGAVEMKRVKLISIQVERVEKAPLDDQGVSRESIDDLSRLNNYLRRWEL